MTAGLIAAATMLSGVVDRSEPLRDTLRAMPTAAGIVVLAIANARRFRASQYGGGENSWGRLSA